MKHFASPGFWFHYRNMPEEIQELADKNFELLKTNPRHPSLRLKKIGGFWTARVGLHYRAIAHEHPEGLIWAWIGDHKDYDSLLKRL
jgi:hypothetical protein